MPDSDYLIRKLQPTDTLNKFKTGNASFLPLKTFLQNQAQQFQQSGIAQTYVAVLDDRTVIGFVTLTCSEIDLKNGYDLADCRQANHYEFLPSVKIARLAVDARHRNSGIGSTLVDYSIALVLDKIAENIGCRFLVTDAKKEAVSFYQRQGFTLLDSEDNQNDEPQVMFLDLKSLA